MLGEGSVTLPADGTSVCSNGWHHFTAVASASSGSLSLHIDGVEWARAAWHTALQRLTSERLFLLRGLWVGGPAVRTISRRVPPRASRGTAAQALELYGLGLVAAALPPSELHAALHSPTPHGASDRSRVGERGPWHGIASVAVRPQPWWASGAAYAEAEALVANAASSAMTLPCAACEGRAVAPSVSLWPQPGYGHAATPGAWFGSYLPMSMLAVALLAVAVRRAECRAWRRFANKERTAKAAV